MKWYKMNANICPLPTMSEDMTTTLGTGAVMLQMIDLCDLISVKSAQTSTKPSSIKSGDLN